jgi:hypothetical protein
VAGGGSFGSSFGFPLPASGFRPRSSLTSHKKSPTAAAEMPRLAQKRVSVESRGTAPPVYRLEPDGLEAGPEGAWAFTVGSPAPAAGPGAGEVPPVIPMDQT